MNMHTFSSFVAAAMLLFAANTTAQAQVCVSPGRDGPASGAIVNTYYPPAAVGTLAVGASSINVGAKRPAAAPDIAVGDMILIIQMQGATINAVNTTAYGADNTTGRGYTGFPATGQAGLYEYKRVISVSGASIGFDTPTANAYVQANATANTQGAQTYQIVRIPQYSSLILGNTTIAPGGTSAWNGSTGGIVAADAAGNINMNGATINVSGAGFRGGGQRTDGHGGGTPAFVEASNQSATVNSGHGQKGEGIAGRPTEVWDGTTKTFAAASGGSTIGYPRAGATVADGNEGRGAPATAGGGGTAAAAGGGGGGNGGEGGIGGHQWNGSISPPASNTTGGLGGVVFAQNAPGRLVLGGAGGAGSSNDAVTGGAGSGGLGGGIVLLRAGSYSGTGNINANGLQGPDNLLNDGAGGGGAGGSVYVSANTGALTGLTVTANGGRGANNDPNRNNSVSDNPHGPGGGGGGGVVFASSALNAASSVAGGTAGVNNAASSTTNNPWGALPGTAGVLNTSAPAPTNSSSGAACLPQLTVVKTTTTPNIILPGQTTAQYVISVSNASTAGVAYGVSAQDNLPSPFTLQAVSAAATSTYTGVLTSGPLPAATNQSGNVNIATFGVSGGTAANSYSIGPGGQVTLTFIVNANTTTVPQTFQNSASVTFVDPTRTTGGSAAAGGNSTATPGANYASGGIVGGSNYASSSSTGDDVSLVGSANLSITKTNNVSSLQAGQTTSYTVTVSNLVPTLAFIGAFVQDPVSPGLSCTSVSCISSGGASCPAPYNPGPAAATSLQAGITLPNMPVNSSVSFIVTCGVLATGQ
jgi:uncharacterized repeat protein (TIGR01451 family)